MRHVVALALALWFAGPGTAPAEGILGVDDAPLPDSGSAPRSEVPTPPAEGEPPATPRNPFGGLLDRIGSGGNRLLSGLGQLQAAQRFQEAAFAGIEGVVVRTRMVDGLVEKSYWIPPGNTAKLAENLRRMGGGEGGLLNPETAGRIADVLTRFGGGRSIQLVARIDPALAGGTPTVRAAGVYIGYTDTAEPPIRDGELAVRMTHDALQQGLATAMPGSSSHGSRPVPNRPRRIASVSQDRGSPVVNPGNGSIDLPFSMHSSGPAGLLPRRQVRTAGVSGSGTTSLVPRVGPDGRVFLDVSTQGNYRAWSNGGLGNAGGEAMANAAGQIPGDAARQLQAIAGNPMIASVTIPPGGNRFSNHGWSGTHTMTGTIELDTAGLRERGFVPRNVFVDRNWAGMDVGFPPMPLGTRPAPGTPASD